jgi:hypothetical protein
MPMTRILSPPFALPQGLARKENIRQWLSLNHRTAGLYFALAEYDQVHQESDAAGRWIRKHLIEMTKFCHLSCSACMAALLGRRLLCTRSTTIWQSSRE